MRRTIQGLVILALYFSQITSAQVTEQFRKLVVNGQSGRAPVLEVGGKTYVEVKRLALIAHGEISFQGNGISLDLSCPEANVREATTKKQPTDDSQLTRECIKAGIERIALM